MHVIIPNICFWLSRRPLKQKYTLWIKFFLIADKGLHWTQYVIICKREYLKKLIIYSSFRYLQSRSSKSSIYKIWTFFTGCFPSLYACLAVTLFFCKFHWSYMYADDCQNFWMIVCYIFSVMASGVWCRFNPPLKGLYQVKCHYGVPKFHY